MRKVIEERKVQVVLTTHSEQVLDPTQACFGG